MSSLSNESAYLGSRSRCRCDAWFRILALALWSHPQSLATWLTYYLYIAHLHRLIVLETCLFVIPQQACICMDSTGVAASFDWLFWPCFNTTSDISQPRSYPNHVTSCHTHVHYLSVLLQVNVNFLIWKRIGVAAFLKFCKTLDLVNSGNV